MITICQRRVPGMNKPAAELAFCFRTGTRLADEKLVRLTSAAQGRWPAGGRYSRRLRHHEL